MLPSDISTQKELAAANFDDQCQEIIKNGSKSFSLAALLFDLKTRRAAHRLYSWCRFCDDQIDEAPDKQTARQRLHWLCSEVELIYGGGQSKYLAFQALQKVVQDYQIPKAYPLDLLQGMRMDVDSWNYQSQADLELYSYHVAGVVGLMMSHIMGVSDPKALENAVHLGIAMQMTNIARDVREDAYLGRIYLPEEWLREEGLERKDVFFSRNLEAQYRVLKRLVQLAKVHYDKGLVGLRYLPPQAALCIGFAAEIYAGIGYKAIRCGQRSLETRTVLSFWEKIGLGLKLSPRLMIYFCRSWFRKFQPAALTEVWRYELKSGVKTY